MSAGGARPKAGLGFLTVVEAEATGLIGGYLLVTLAGRPIEFHCTAPVRPNRAQQILFGPTLRPYLLGEQIGRTLLGKSSLAPLAVWTDVDAALAVREFTDVPVALVLLDGIPAPAGTATLELGNNRLAVAERYAVDAERLRERAQELAAFDLAEPFGRIRAAIDEAQKSGRGQAA
jgi:hypothetical protein